MSDSASGAFKRRKHRLTRDYLLHTTSTLLFKVVRAVIIIGLCFIILYPFFVKVTNAFMIFDDFMDPNVKYIPKHFTLDYVRTAFIRMDYVRTILNTLALSGGVALLQTLICSTVGYGFARYKFGGSRLFFAIVVMTLIVPPQTIIIPLYNRFQHFFEIPGLFGGVNVLGGYIPLVVLAITGMGLRNGLYIFLFRQYYRNVPKELEEAAYIDGYNSFQTYLRIMLPSGVSLMVTVFLLGFSWQWTDTVYTPLFAGARQVVPIMINRITSGEDPIVAQALQNTGAILAVLPLALLYIVAQRFFVQGIERSGITG